jgi:hypothetical protein
VNRSSTRVRLFVIAICLAVLAPRIVGAHLHLCLDGSEPPLSYHVADSGIHHAEEHGAGESHSDRDMQVGGDVLAKKSTHDQDAAALWFVFALLLFLLAPARRIVPTADPPRLRSVFSWLRPPLRGPPVPA